MQYPRAASPRPSTAPAEIVTLLALVAAYVPYALHITAPSFVFEAEHDLFFTQAWRLVHEGVLSWQGPPIGPFAAHHGPVFFLLLAPLTWLAPDPVSLQVIFVGLTGAAGLLLHRLLRRVVAWPIAAFAVFGLLTSLFAFEANRQLWHSSLLPVPVCGFLLLAARALTDPRPLRPALGAAVCAALATQLHVQAGVYGLLFGGVLVARRRALGWRGVLLAGATALLALTPLLLGLWESLASGAGSQASRYLTHSESERPVDPLAALAYLATALAPAWRAGAAWESVLWLVLALAGAGAAVRRRSPIGLLLVANLLLGFALLVGLFGYSAAPRYLHTVAYATFGLAALGLDLLVSWLPSRTTRRAALGVLGALAALAVTEAAVWRPTPRGLTEMTAHDQQALASLVSQHLRDDSLKACRVHGLYASDVPRLLGMGYFHRVAQHQAADRAVSKETHVLVVPASLELTPAARERYDVTTVQGRSRRYQVHRYAPLIDYDSLAVTGPAGDSLWQRWCYDCTPPASGPHSVSLHMTGPGPLHLLLRNVPQPDRCSVEATLDGEPLPAGVELRAGGRLLRYAVPHPGQIEVALGACGPELRADVF